MKDLETIRGHRVRLFRDTPTNLWVFWCSTCDLTEHLDNAADGVRALIGHTKPEGVTVGADIAATPAPAQVPADLARRAS